MKNRKIWGTDLYVSFEGFIFDENNIQIKTRVRNGYYYFIYKTKTYLVHRVVAEAFIKQSKKRIKHIDNDKKNNSAWNLEYI